VQHGQWCPWADPLTQSEQVGERPRRRVEHIADYALLGAALGHQCDDSQISLFWLSREGRTALQVRAMEGRNPGVIPGSR
jgi:hypothetical protein